MVIVGNDMEGRGLDRLTLVEMSNILGGHLLLGMFGCFTL
jgi:hypothetical protein